MAIAVRRSELRQLLSGLMHGKDTVVGTPSGNVLEAGRFDAAALSAYPDGYFDDWYGRFYLGTHKDTDFAVSAFQNPDGNKVKAVINIEPDLSAVVEIGDLFEMHQEFTPVEMNNKLNMAISMVEEEALQNKVDASLAVVASTFEYVIPTGLLYIDQIFQEQGTDGRYSASLNLIDTRHWRILLGATPKIWFDSNYVSLTTGRNLRLVGQGIQSELSVDADTSSIPKAFLLYQAKALLHQSLVRGEGAEFDEHRSQMILAQSMADRERERLMVAGRGTRVSH